MQVTVKFYSPTARQLIAHTSPKRHILYGGGLGGGKTRFLCEDAKSHMLQLAGNRGFIGRAYYSDYMLTTHVELLNVLAEDIANGVVIQNKSEKWFQFANGSQLWYGGLDQDTGAGGLGKKNKLFSAEFGWIGIDQGEELTEDQFNKTASRLRLRLPNGINPPWRYVITANPSQNWLKTRFLLAPNTNTDEFIPALATDNPHLPEGYTDQLKSLFRNNQSYIEALINGSWDSVGSVDDLLSMSDIQKAFYKNNDNGTILTPIIRPYEHRVISIDPAYFGDDSTVIYGFQNERVLEKIKYGKQDPMYTVGMALHLESRMNGGGQANALFAVDDTGGYGSGIVSRLKEMGKNVLAVNFSNGEPEGVDPHFLNRRAEIYWDGADEIKLRQVAVPENDITLHGQLASVKYSFVRSKIKLQEKEQIKKLLGSSPDESDSFMIGLYGLRLLRRGIVQQVAPWEEQKPYWQQLREQRTEESEYAMETNNEPSGGYF